MANLPQSGDSNWGTTLNSFLLVARNNDGTMKNSTGGQGITHFEVLTQSEYDNLNKNSSALYFII